MLVPAVVSAITYDSSLSLENKDGSWVVIPDGIVGTLDFNSSGAEFEYSFSATGLEASTEYSLIYYADEPDRFVDWGGANPGTLIATFTTDGTGAIAATAGSTELNMSLPCPPDANIAINNYCPEYTTCYGAKIWLVPSDCYSEPAVTTWSPSRFLFETDLIYYTDTDIVTVTATICEDVVGCSVSPNTIDFGYVTAGACNVPVGAPIAIVVTNTSTADPPDCKSATNIDVSADVTGDVLKVGLLYANTTGVCDGSLVDNWAQPNVTTTATMSNIKYFVPGDATGDIGGIVTITCVATP